VRSAWRRTGRGDRALHAGAGAADFLAAVEQMLGDGQED
jgi:hypothetical protein